MKRALWISYLLALHLVLAAVLLKPHAMANKIGGDTFASDLLHTMRTVHAHADATVPAGSVIFLGDSITMGLATAAVAPLSVNFGVVGQRSDQLIESMDGYHCMARAAAVVVTIGTNDLPEGRTAGIRQRYRAILAKVPAGVPVVLSSVPPNVQHDVRPVVDAARQACAADARCTFVDASGLPPGSLRPDGVHLTPAGYAAWIEMLREALRPQMSGGSARV